jgi:hypothetical protein
MSIGIGLRRGALGVVAATSVAMGAAVMASAPASASYGQCPDESGYLCFWKDPNWSGGFGKVEDRNSDWRKFYGGCGTERHWSDCVSSIRNEGLSCEAVVYNVIGYGEPHWVINRDTEASDLRQWGRPDGGGTWDNAISSNNWWC